MLSGIKKKDFIKFKGIVYMVLSYEGGGLYRCVIMNGSGAGNIDLYGYETLCLGELVYSYEQLDSLKDTQGEELVNRYDVIKELRKNIDDKNEIIESLHNDLHCRQMYAEKVVYERNKMHSEMSMMVRDHEEECDVYEQLLKEHVDIDDIHRIISNYITHNFTTESAVVCILQLLDEIKKFIDNQKKES